MSWMKVSKGAPAADAAARWSCIATCFSWDTVRWMRKRRTKNHTDGYSI